MGRKCGFTESGSYFNFVKKTIFAKEFCKEDEDYDLRYTTAQTYEIIIYLLNWQTKGLQASFKAKHILDSRGI